MSGGRLWRVLLLGASLLLPASLLAATGGPLPAFLASTQSFRADFIQTVHSKSGRKPQTSSGVLMISRPGKFRWQVDKPYAQLIVGDGQKVWLYDPDLKQVTVRKMAEALNGTPAAILAGNLDAAALHKAFALSDAGLRDGVEWVEARPHATDAGFVRVLFGFRDAQLAAMELYDHFGQVTVIAFHAAERNPRLSEQVFRFVPPPGVDVAGE